MPTYSNEGSVTHAIGAKPTRLFPPGETSFETPLIIDHLEGVVRTNDTPRFNLLRSRTDLSFSGAGQQGVSFEEPHLVKAILVSASIDVDMYFHDSENNPPKRLLANKEYALEPGGMVETIIITAPAACTVIVEEVGAVAPGVTFGGEAVTFGGAGVSW